MDIHRYTRSGGSSRYFLAPWQTVKDDISKLYSNVTSAATKLEQK